MFRKETARRLSVYPTLLPLLAMLLLTACGTLGVARPGTSLPVSAQNAPTAVAAQCKQTGSTRQTLEFIDSTIFDVEAWKKARPNDSCICPSGADSQQRACLNDMLRGTADSFNHVLSPEESADYTAAQAGFGGVGLELEQEEEGFPVSIGRVIEGTPAAATSLRAGDLIVRVDNTDVSKMTQSEVVKLLRGNIGTKVRVRVQRDGKLQPLVEITRALIDPPEVRFVDLTGDVLYIRLSSFNKQRTARSIAARMSSRQYSGFILDLRDNPGGLTNIVYDVSHLFLEKGLIYSVRERNGGSLSNPIYSNREYKIVEQSSYRPQAYLVGRKPLIVLINARTASSAEILTGALKDNDAATIIGIKSYGKGIGQTVMELNNGTFAKVTSFRYYTPSGVWPGDADKQRIGIEPDIDFDRPIGKLEKVHEDEAVQRALQVISGN